MLTFLLVIGCSEDEPIMPTDQGVSTETSIFFNSLTLEGIERDFILYLPESYDGSTAVPLLFNFHGYTQSASFQFSYGNMRSIADTANFILVYPQGKLLNGNTHWNVGSWTKRSNSDDLGFTDAMIEAIASDYNIDLTRIYACGYSNGGAFSFELACRLSDRIAAIGSVSGMMTDRTQNNCSPSHPIPMISIHGTADNIVQYNGNIPEEIMSQSETLAYWATFNNTDPDPTIVDIPDINNSDGSTVEFLKYPNGDKDVSVEHYKITGGGHDWPGKTGNMDIDASHLIWNFVSKFDINGRME